MRRFFLAMASCLIGAVAVELHADGQWQDFTLSRSLPTIYVCTSDALTDKNEVPVRYRVFTPQDLALKAVIPSCERVDEEGWQRGEIRYRGNSSRSFAKKQYQLTHLDTDGKKADVSLLGLPKDDKWVLNAPYVDRSSIRNAFVFDLADSIAEGKRWAAPKSAFSELWLNGEFKGLFVVLQKIGRGKSKLNLPKNSTARPYDVSFIGEVSFNDGPFKTDARTPIDIRYPDESKVDEWRAENEQKAEIIIGKVRRQINRFEKALGSKQFDNPEVGYRQYIDVDSFIDFMLVQEITLNVDGYRRSAYFHKRPDSKIVMGPLWDYNLALGNLRAFGLHRQKGWLYQRALFVIGRVFWFNRLIEDPYFRDRLVTRYKLLRRPGKPLCDQHIEARLAHFGRQLGDAGNRDLKRWQGTYSFLQKHMMRTRDSVKSHVGHIVILSKWLKKRLDWMDRHIDEIGK